MIPISQTATRATSTAAPWPARVSGLRRAALLGLVAAALARAAPAQESDPNAWPLLVGQAPIGGGAVSWSSLGPLLFRSPAPVGGLDSGFRPFWIQSRDANGDLRSVLSLYPLFSYAADADTYRWSVFELINHSGLKAGAPPTLSLLEQRESFDVWPFWFSRQTADPDTTYRALFPIFGTLKHRFGFDRLFWAPFPFYVQTESHGATTVQTPWPFLRRTSGTTQGFALWPLFGWENGPGVSSSDFFLWPLGFDRVTPPKADAPAGTAPRRESGVLPFYTRADAPGLVDRTYVWPFLGYTHKTAPDHYDETRWFWPFLVQGRGDTKYVNRWGPFYTHSVVDGYNKTWIAWPIFREATWMESGLIQTKKQGLFFIYWSLEQRSATNPNLAPAHVTHLWPLFSLWDNGAGRRQWQAFSPFDAPLTDNEKMRRTWTDIFAFARYNQAAPGETRGSLLWNAITWRHSAKAASHEFHLGPLLSVETKPESSRIAIGSGLIGLRRPPGARFWRPFLFDFSSFRGPAPVPPPS